jgi:hypothetical protein
MEYKETGIPCFECGKHSGIDCPGRKPNESTRCIGCMEKFMKHMITSNNIMEEDKDILKRLAE